MKTFRMNERIQDLDKFNTFLTKMQHKFRLRLIKACYIIQKRWRLKQMKIRFKTIRIIETLIKEDDITMENVRASVKDMKETIDQIFMSKIIDFIEPAIIKLQRIYRKNKLRGKFQIHCRQLISINKSFKALF